MTRPIPIFCSGFLQVLHRSSMPSQISGVYRPACSGKITIGIVENHKMCVTNVVLDITGDTSPIHVRRGYSSIHYNIEGVQR